MEKKSTEEKYKALLEAKLTDFCRDNPSTNVARSCKTETGFADMTERIKQVKEKHFKHQASATIADMLGWIDGNDYESEEE
jgi:hypothetical protein